MTKNELLAAIAGVLTTALETEPDLFPESMVYLILGSDLRKYEIVRDVLLNAGWITIQFNTIHLTESGRATALECERVMSGVK
jgi:hypothetical protein